MNRAFDILEAFMHDGRKLGISELAALTGLPKSTVFRFVNACEVRGYVLRDMETGKYFLGYKILELAKHLLDKLEIRQQARPYLDQLVRLCGETVYLITLMHGETVYVDRVEGTRNLRLRAEIGSRGYAHSSASGKVLLSELSPATLRQIIKKHGLPSLTANTITDFDYLVKHLAEVKERGYAIDDIENEEDVRCVASPIRDFSGRIIAALSVSGPSIRLTMERIHELAPLVMDTAAKISAGMGYKA